MLLSGDQKIFAFSNTVNPLLIIFQALLRGGGGLKEGGIFNLTKCINRSIRFLEDGLVVTGHYTAFSNRKKMVTILHGELEHKVEKVQHMKLEVLWPKTKNNMNFKPE